MPSTVQKYLGVPATWPVKENIKHEIVLMPNKRDIRTAKPRDPCACALHNAACRIFDIPNCAIGAGSAYIPQRDARGKFYIARVRPTAETQRAIKRFDKTGEMPEGGFRFVPVSDGITLKKLRTYSKKWARGKVGNSSLKRAVKRRRAVPSRAIPRAFAVAA